MPVAQSAKVPLVTGVSSAANLTEKGNTWFFRATETDALLAKSFAKILVNQLKLKKVAYIGVNDDFGRGGVEEFEKQMTCARRHDRDEGIFRARHVGLLHPAHQAEGLGRRRCVRGCRNPGRLDFRQAEGGARPCDQGVRRRLMGHRRFHAARRPGLERHLCCRALRLDDEDAQERGVREGLSGPVQGRSGQVFGRGLQHAATSSSMRLPARSRPTPTRSAKPCSRPTTKARMATSVSTRRARPRASRWCLFSSRMAFPSSSQSNTVEK